VGGIALVALALTDLIRIGNRRGATAQASECHQAPICDPADAVAVAAVVMIPLNIDDGPRVMTLITSSTLFGATATVCTGFLFTQRPLRSLMVAATVDFDHAERAPGVRARLILMWAMCSALPGAASWCCAVASQAGSSQDNAPIEVPVMVLALVAVIWDSAR